MTHPAFSAGYVAALTHVVSLIRAGAEPSAVAAYVLSLGCLVGPVSRAIEERAMPGTFAEAVFCILAD